MAKDKSVKELREQREDVRRWQHSSNKLLKQYIDFREEAGHIPKPLRPGYKALRQFARSTKQRRKKLTRKIRRKKNRDKGRDKALAYARKQIGTTEQPPGSNDGGKVRKWWSWLGYTFPVPWCGCFAGFSGIKKGKANIPAKLRLGYTPYIDADAKAGQNGLTDVGADGCKKGTYVVFHFGAGGAKHVGIATGPVRDGLITTIDGNTSSGTSGSQDNGGGVFERTRPISQVIRFADPDY